MLTAALVVSDGLGRGFDRAAGAADLPDAIVRFDPEPAGQVAARIAALPDLAAFSLRREFTGVELDAPGHTSENAAVEIIGPGRRGYAIVAGRDLSGRPGEVLVERGLAAAWGMPLGGRIELDGSSPQRVVGFTESPDNVSYPLAGPRVYVAQVGVSVPPGVNLAEIWLRDPHRLDEVLVQARATSYGIHGLRFVTRSGVRVLLDQAAGIVIDLLVALSLIALATAAAMLAASARAEVQRRLRGIGVRRAVGASRGYLVSVQALEAAFVAAPAATIGALGGLLATYGPTTRLLVLLNEPAPGSALAPALAGAWLGAVAIPVLAAAWPAWRAAGRPPVALLRGAELSGGARGRARSGRGPAIPRAGLTVLGARLAGARRVRLVATAATLGFSTAFVLLMLALASALSSLETDPGALGRRYQLTANLPASAAAHVRSIAGVQATAPRYETGAVDSFSLGETIDVIAYPGDHTIFEAPPLVSGTRLHGAHEAEVGLGLAQALGLTPGSTLAIELASGPELRLRVAGVVSSLDHDGRIAYVPAQAMLAADPGTADGAQLAVRLKPGASASVVSAALGPSATPATGAVGRGVPLVAVLRSILRAVAIVDGLVCLYALIQACALIVQERRRTVSVLRAFGAGPSAVRRLLSGAVIALVAPAALLGILLERALLGPALAHLAASYVTLSLGASGTEIAVVLAGLVLAGAVAVAWVARQIARESVIAGLGAS
ncbi:MAG: FtsX-like permease family protein [Solirubrobacterales bacterium]|nr:FtsX-like permease family protein [Solirubrobacterales bacterium]